MSLRTKFMLALLLTGLAAVAMVGGLAYAGMTKKDDWKANHGKEGFDDFMLSRGPLAGEGRPERRGEPPYHFILADQDYRVLLGAGRGKG